MLSGRLPEAPGLKDRTCCGRPGPSQEALVSFQQASGAGARGSPEGCWTFPPQHISRGWGSRLGEEPYLGGALSAKGLRASRDRTSASLAKSLPARWMTHSLCS